MDSQTIELHQASETGEDLAIPEMMFAQGEEPVGVRVLTYQSTRAINVVLNALQADEVQTIRESTFGKLVEIAEKPAFSGRFIRYLLSRQLKVNKKHEVWFRFAGRPIRFSLREFAIVTGLNGGEYPKRSKCKMKANLSEQPYWLKLFGKLDVVSVKAAVKMLRRKTVQDKNIRIKIACLALLSSVLLSTNINMKISREHAEAIADIEEFFRFPWGRMAFDMLMSSIKERDEISLSQKSIAVKGFALAIQLVLVEAVPPLNEVVVEHLSSSESDSDDDADDFRKKSGKNHTLSPGHARLVDSKYEGEVKCVIEQDPSRPVDQNSLEWSDEEEDVKLENLLRWIKTKHVFTKDMFRGGATLVDVARMTELTKANRKDRKQLKPHPSGSRNELDFLDNIVMRHLQPEVARLDQNIVSVTAGVTEVLDKVGCLEERAKSVVGPMLAVFKEEVLSLVARLVEELKCEGQRTDAIQVQEANMLGRMPYAEESRGDDNEESIREVIENINKYFTPVRSGDHDENSLDVNAVIVPDEPSFFLGLTQEGVLDTNRSITIAESDASPIHSNGVDAQSSSPIAQSIYTGAETVVRRRSKRARVAPAGVLADYKWGSTLSKHTREAGKEVQSYADATTIEAKFCRLQEKMEETFVINFMGLAVSSKDLADIVGRVRPLTSKVVDILVNLIRSNIATNLGLLSGTHATFLDTRFLKAFSRAYPKFRKCKNRESFCFSKGLVDYLCSPRDRSRHGSPYYLPFIIGKKHWVGLCVSCTKMKIIVLDCNPTLRSNKALAADLYPLCFMLPYLMKQVGVPSLPDVLTAFSIDRPSGIEINSSIPEPGLTAMLLMQSHAVGGINACKVILPANIATEAQRAAVMVYEHHQKLL